MTQYADTLACANSTEDKVRTMKMELVDALDGLNAAQSTVSPAGGTSDEQRLSSQIENCQTTILKLEKLCELRSLFEDFDAQLNDGKSWLRLRLVHSSRYQGITNAPLRH